MIRGLVRAVANGESHGVGESIAIIVVVRGLGRDV